jgi:methylenetetrahydrofolate dehydrogenase (NADP+)/methenyltetrahydrofolate cyclohydrolase
VLATVHPDKEVEGIHGAHTRRLSPLSTEPPRLLPLVPVAILTMLAEIGFDPFGSHVVVLVDPEQLEANPVAKMVARSGAFAALPLDAIGVVVPYTHPRARELCRAADLLVVSLNQPKLVTADWVGTGATVVDYNWICTGTRPHPRDPERTLPRIVGGVDVESVSTVAKAISPIPGGIGPVMLGILIERIVQAAVDRAARRADAVAA